MALESMMISVWKQAAGGSHGREELWKQAAGGSHGREELWSVVELG